jgi:hypothetical protein
MPLVAEGSRRLPPPPEVVGRGAAPSFAPAPLLRPHTPSP